MQYQSNHILIDGDEIYRFNMAVDIDSDLIIEPDTYEPVRPHEPDYIMSLEDIAKMSDNKHTPKGLGNWGNVEIIDDFVRLTVGNDDDFYYSGSWVDPQSIIAKQGSTFSEYYDTHDIWERIVQDNEQIKYNKVDIIYRANTSSTIGNIFPNGMLPGISYDIISDGEWHTVTIDVSKIKYYQITAFRFDFIDNISGLPSMQSGDYIDIKSVKFYNDD